jgi:hypothetical protein
MRHIKITIPHSLPPDTALERIKGLLANLQQEHAAIISNASQDWNELDGKFLFTAKGFTITGKLKVTENSVIIESKLPFLLSFYSGKITELVKVNGEELLKSQETVGVY